MRYALAVAVLASFGTLSAVASAQRGDQPSGSSKGGAYDQEEKSSPWKGSTLILDQSVTTQTVGVGADYQSYNPLYEIWIPFRPKYTVFTSESKKTTVSLNGWANFFLEVTNSDTTTTQREPVLGPTYLWATLSQTLWEQNDSKTTVAIGPRIAFPTDKESRLADRYGALGASGGVSQAISLQGKSAPAFNSMKLGISGIYWHNLNRYTTPTNDNIKQPRQDIGSRLVTDNQLRFAMNVSDSVNLYFTSGVQLTPKLELGLSYIILNSWTYKPPPLGQMPIATGPAEPQRIVDPTTYRVNTWALASLDYEVIDEMSVGIGYYNLTNQVGPDGQRRSPLWSPDARFFLSVTAHLDAILQRFTATPPAPVQTASAK